MIKSTLSSSATPSLWEEKTTEKEISNDEDKEDKKDAEGKVEEVDEEKEKEEKKKRTIK